MNRINVAIRNESNNYLPHYATEEAAGVDLRAFLSKPILLESGKRTLVSTGLFMELPKGFEAQIRPRSGLAYKHGITVLNSPGTIDSDYRGELKVLLINHGEETFEIQSGERIAQMVIAAVTQTTWEETTALSDSQRGAGGFGSTGKK
jgi:dUTP pyrophosphatase